MDILELISNEGKLVLVSCHFAQENLDHLENLLYNLDLENCNPLPIKSIFYCVECYEVRGPSETKLN